MEQHVVNESAKKVNLEDLPRDELVKKCKALLAIAQKAKQTKDVLHEENILLKSQLEQKVSTNEDVSQEIIENLTQQKLSLVTTIEDLKCKNSSLCSNLQKCEKELHAAQEKLNTIDNENTSNKRQIIRLTEENEQLLSHLETLEKQIEELNKIGMQQREQLLQLENSNLEVSTNQEHNVKIEELQNMLKISLDEVKKLKNENFLAQEEIGNLQTNLTEKEKHIVTVSEELVSANQTIEQLNTSLSKFGENNEKVAGTCEKDCDNLPHNDFDKEENVRLKEKLKLYHSKIVKFAGNVKTVKEEKNQILHIFKNYTEQVKEWKDQLNTAGKSLIDTVNKYEAENKTLQEEMLSVKHENEKLTERLDELIRAEQTCKGKIENLTKEKEIVASKLEKIVTKYDNETKILIDQNEKENLELKNQIIDSENMLATLSNKHKDVVKSNHDLQQQLESVTNELESLKNLNRELHQFATGKTFEIQRYMIDIRKLEEHLRHKENVISKLQNANDELRKDLENFSQEKEALIMKYKEEIKMLKQTVFNFPTENELNKLRNTVSELENELEKSKTTEKQLAEKSSEEILKLVCQNKDLNKEVADLQATLDNLKKKNICFVHYGTQTEGTQIYSGEVEEQLTNLRRENAELLHEMNEMNQALKERGETISKLQAHCEEIIKKLQIYETQANKNVDSLTEKDEIIKNLKQELDILQNKTDDVKLNNSLSAKCEEIESLKSELEMLKEKLNSNADVSYAESDVMSTSTISRTDEVNRLKDLEGSWEEKYSKLRSLAIKLKGKIREQSSVILNTNAEKEEIHKKLSVSLKTIQSLQTENDKLQDDLENSKKECQNYLKQLSTTAEEISKNKQVLASNEETIVGLKAEIERLQSEKQALDDWKKKISSKVQTLRKELEAKNLMKREFDENLSKLNVTLETTDRALKAEIEAHKHTKTLLEQLNNECKKNSVLNLEMQDYERSVKELSQKIEKKNEQINIIQSQLDSQKNTISALREQNKILEGRIEDEQTDLTSATSELNSLKKKINNLEDTIRQKDDKISSITQQLEISRSENEELSTELSKILAEHQKSVTALKSERDFLRSQTVGLQQNLREAQDTLKLREDELKSILNDYEGYKVRAQSVLRQNQSRDVGMEEKLLEELAALKERNNELISELNEFKEKTNDLEDKLKKSLIETEELSSKCQELENKADDLQSQYSQLSTKHQKTLNEHAETVRSLKVHAETLSQCYRQQISEQEVRHNREIIELQSRLEKAPTPTEINPVHPNMPREEGEGSESVESLTSPNMHPVPLERLLASDSEQEITYMKKQLCEQESKVAHLTALLSDTEQDLVKHVQMNKLLKEEIRRQQRSVEREQHAENLEYLKNVVFKFATLNNGDERSRLVPVLNTILKFSPEEAQKLFHVAKGDPGLRGWTNYLPAWPSPNKPQ